MYHYVDQRNHPADMLHDSPDWRKLFSKEILEQTKKDKSLQKIKISPGTWYYMRRFEIIGTRPKITVEIDGEPRYYGDDWSRIGMRCTCRQKYCVHMAAALQYWEKEHGPWIVWEDESDYRRRKKKEEIKEGLKKRQEESEKIGTWPVPAMDAFKGRVQKGPVLFDMEKVLAEYETYPYAIHRMKQLLGEKPAYGSRVEVLTTREGEKSITFSQSFQDNLEAEYVWGTLDGKGLSLSYDWREKDGDYYVAFSDPEDLSEDDDLLDEYQLVTISRIWDRIDLESLSEVTDTKAEKFFNRIRKMREEGSQVELRTVDSKVQKKENVSLVPRIVIEEGEPMLSFKIGTEGSRKYVVKDCYQLIDSAKGEKTLALGKKETLDFSRQDFSESSVRLYEFIQRHRTQSYGGMYQISLKGSSLDNFYDMYEGGECELTDKTNHLKDLLIRIGHLDIRFVLTADKLTDARGTFLGISVSGFVPVLIKGSSHQYVLNSDGLSRISAEEKKVLDPFLEVSDAAGYFRFQVGTGYFREFYYRVLPGLLDNPFVEFVDNCREEASSFLPPEPQFTFFLDMDDNAVTLTGKVRYDEQEYALTPSVSQTTESQYRDTDQEQRVIRAVSQWFPDVNKDGTVFTHSYDDNFLYDLLTAGILSLEFYGAVNGSSRFRALKVQRPSVQIGISVSDSNLLDISVTSKDLSPKELLSIYGSYKKKKRFFRLKSGDFIDLTGETSFGEIDEFMSQMNLDTKDVLKKKVSLPMYRALYVNKMLENRDALVGSRDRTYRALIRSFKTVQEADFEIPSALEDTLRPYQSYGYKWLRTIQSAGFGGILADEMGLGKTVQMIAVFDNDRLSGSPEQLPSLVVCPASLIYNWQEELRRFAPEIRASVIAGTAAARKQMIADMGNEGVFITSYDLLKRDIALYEGRQFQNCVIDEAQYIKNAAAAASKCVKLIQAKHRFALTGTPIENRLSELWSIFDFLMPGFLYSHADFEKSFERPIAKEHDADAMEKLKAMTAPFILRRKKEDVLKDLPDKLEEVRYARISGEQQRLYDAQVLRMKGMLDESGSTGEEKIKMFAELTRIRQICCDPALVFDDYKGESAKRDACMELIRSAIEGGHRILLFSQFVTMLEMLEEDLKKEQIPYYKIIGSTPKEKRISLVRTFNEGAVPVFLISLKAGGTGLNLTGADVVIHYDPWWNLAAQNQATDRAHRIGQEKQVTVYKLILKDTIEERIQELQDAKRDLAESILEGDRKSIMSLSAEELLALLN